MVPPGLGDRETPARVSGVAEIAGGLGVLPRVGRRVPPQRRWLRLLVAPLMMGWAWRTTCT